MSTDKDMKKYIIQTWIITTTSTYIHILTYEDSDPTPTSTFLFLIYQNIGCNKCNPYGHFPRRYAGMERSAEYSCIYIQGTNGHDPGSQD